MDQKISREATPTKKLPRSLKHSNQINFEGTKVVGRGAKQVVEQSESAKEIEIGRISERIEELKQKSQKN